MGMRISVIIYTYYFITELMASEKAKVERRYDRWSRYYDTVDTFPGIGRLEKRWRLEAIESLELKPDDMVLDVGTGTGLILPWIAERLTTGKVMGIDLSENMLEKARERAGKCGVEDRVELRKMDIEKMGFEDGSFDKVIATYTLTTVPDHAATIAEMHRVVKKGGLVVILDTGKPKGLAKIPYYPMLAAAKLFGRTHFDKDVIGELRKQKGWKITKERRHYGGMVYCIITEKI